MTIANTTESNGQGVVLIAWVVNGFLPAIWLYLLLPLFIWWVRVCVFSRFLSFNFSLTIIQSTSALLPFLFFLLYCFSLLFFLLFNNSIFLSIFILLSYFCLIQAFCLDVFPFFSCFLLLLLSFFSFSIFRLFFFAFFSFFHQKQSILPSFLTWERFFFSLSWVVGFLRGNYHTL